MRSCSTVQKLALNKSSHVLCAEYSWISLNILHCFVSCRKAINTVHIRLGLANAIPVQKHQSSILPIFCRFLRIAHPFSLMPLEVHVAYHIYRHILFLPICNFLSFRKLFVLCYITQITVSLCVMFCVSYTRKYCILYEFSCSYSQ